MTLYEVDEDDFEKVIAIRDYTWDYLSGCYEIMLRTPDTKGFALKMDDELIAFLSITLLADKKKCILRFGRVKKSFEGTGVFKLLCTKIIRHYMITKNLKTLTKYSVSTSHQEITRVHNGISRYIGMRIAAQFITNTPIIPELSDDLPVLVEEVCSGGLDLIFKDKSLCKILFPTGFFVALQIPFELVNSNIKKIFNHKSYLLKSGHSENVLLSYSVHLPCKEGCIIHLDLHGNLESNLKDHIDIHLRRIIAIIGQVSQILLIVNVDERHINMSELHFVARTFGFRLRAEKICIMSQQKTRKMCQ